MEIKTKDFQKAANTILFAVGVDKSADNLEIKATGGKLFLTVSNKEYYVVRKFDIDSDETFRITVDAQAFLNLISGITTDAFELKVLGTTVVVKSGKSSYKLALVYDNGDVMALEPIKLNNVMVQQTISGDILNSIVNINSKELVKSKGLNNITEVQKLYYLTQDGCFTCVTGACLNRFSLEKPIKLLLNDRIVKLFKLFSSDVAFSYGVDKDFAGGMDAKVIFQTSDIYVAAKVCNEDILINNMTRPYEATKGLLAETYPNHIVVSVNDLSAAISRLTTFTKNSLELNNNRVVLATIKVSTDELVITDTLENTEVVAIENTGYCDEVGYVMKVNLIDLKLAIDSYKNEHVTLNCGNKKALVINHANVDHLIPDIIARA